ncbi:MAG: hypothetical protein ACLP59_01795 [Bryobacteraceae bacterium]
MYSRFLSVRVAHEVHARLDLFKVTNGSEGNAIPAFANPKKPYIAQRTARRTASIPAENRQRIFQAVPRPVGRAILPNVT